MSTALPQPNASLTVYGDIGGPPTTYDRFVDKATRILAVGFATGTIVLLAAIVYMIAKAAFPAMKSHGAFRSSPGVTYDTNRDEYGLQAPILGTLYSSLLALVIASVFGLAIAIFLSQGFLPPGSWKSCSKTSSNCSPRSRASSTGWWGIFVIIPLLRPPSAEFLSHHVGWFPLFHGTLAGPEPAARHALVLAIMVLPTIKRDLLRRPHLGSPQTQGRRAFGLFWGHAAGKQS